MAARKQSSTSYPIQFLLVSSTDHVTAVTSAAVTVTLSKNGAAFGAATGAVSEISSGWYSLAGNATDRNTVGELLLHATATGADPVDAKFDIVAADPFAADLSITGLVAASVTGAVGSVTAGVSLSAGAVTAVWAALTSALTTVGSIGKLIVDNLDAAVSSRLASVSYTAPPSAAAVADQVWDEAIAGHTVSGSTGATLTEIDAAVSTLGAATVTVVSPVASSGSASIVRGDDYASAESRRLSWTGTSWPDITGATIALGIRARTGWTVSIAGVVVSSTQAAVALTAAQTALFPLGDHAFDLQATLANGHVVTLVRGHFTVLEDYA